MSRNIVIPYSASATSDSRQAAINALIQSALDTGDWSALENYSPTEKEINTAISKSSYKNSKGLSTAQHQQLTLAISGKYNKYKDNKTTEVIEEDVGKGASATQNGEAAEILKTQSMEDTIKNGNALLSQYSSINNGYVRPDYTNVDNATVANLAQLQQQLGTNINYDFNSIKGIYDDATRAANEIEQQSGAERNYYQHLAAAQNTALDTIRQQYAGAIANGASKGMQAAQQLSTILGTANTANEEATQLAIDKQTRANQYASQIAQNAKDALSYSNQQQMDLANLSRTLYNDTIQKQTAQLAYNQSLNSDAANVAAAYTTAQGNLNSSLANTVAGMYNNNQSAIAQLQSAIASANATKYAADRQRTTSGKGAVTT